MFTMIVQIVFVSKRALIRNQLIGSQLLLTCKNGKKGKLLGAAAIYQHKEIFSKFDSRIPLPFSSGSINPILIGLT
jgi:hypothetical protein